MSALNLIELGLEAQRMSVASPAIPDSVKSVDKSLTGWPFSRHSSFAELVQDRASELITNDCDDRARCREIFEELYQRATEELK